MNIPMILLALWSALYILAWLCGIACAILALRTHRANLKLKRGLGKLRSMTR